jgi:2-haloacid dehalogenase
VAQLPGPETVVVFDVNETLSDMAPIAQRFADLGAPPHLARLWFASLLRDAFARTAAGATERFAVLADAALRSVLHGVPVDRPADAAVAHVLDGFAALDVHPDVVDGVRALRAAGFRLATLSNGGAHVAEALLGRAGIRGEFERVLSVEDAGVWKPAPGSYHYAARELGVEPSGVVLVAVHPWDVDGAGRAGCATAFLDRDGAPYPGHARPPDHTVAAVGELAGVLRR